MADSTVVEIAPSDDCHAGRWRIPVTTRVSRSLDSGDSKVGRHAWLIRRGSEFRPPPAWESMTVCQPGGVHVIEIEVFPRAAFESLRLLNLKCLS
jgi:hypothetical protein